MNSVVVTGGAGYIGSHMVQALRRAGYRTVVVDNLSHGHAFAVRSADLIVEDIADKGAMRAVLLRHRPAAIIHFAASCSVEESVSNPLHYYRNNVAATLGLLEIALEAAVPRFIFSSTAAVYGEPQETPIRETHPTQPINPYGATKLVGEQLLADAARAYGIQYMAFRYFNAAGCDADADLGEDHRPETHLIPLAIRAAMAEDELKVFGTDYPTRDGSCIRDYVHVMDLAEAHLLGLQHLEQGGENRILNLGTETGTSVLEIIEAVQRVTGLEVPHQKTERRPGDPAVLVASPAKAKEVLGWEPELDLDSMIRSAYDFMRRHPEGYPAGPAVRDELTPLPERAEVD